MLLGATVTSNETVVLSVLTLCNVMYVAKRLDGS